METLETKKVPLSTHVDVELAAEVRRLADAGNRSVSREVAAAIHEHVAAQSSLERVTTYPRDALGGEAA